MSPRIRRTFIVVLPLVVVTAIAAGCGGGSTKTSSSTSTTAPAASSGSRSSGAAAFAKYTSCLESHGVPASQAAARGGGFRRPGSGTGGTPPSTTPGQTFTRPTIPSQYQAAYNTCRSDLPTGGFGGFGGSGGLNSAALTTYRNCLVIHGVTLPTTTTTKPGATPSGGGGFGGGAGAFAGLANNPKFKAAEQACASLLPAGFRGGSTPTTTTSPAA